MRTTYCNTQAMICTYPYPSTQSAADNIREMGSFCVGGISPYANCVETYEYSGRGCSQATCQPVPPGGRWNSSVFSFHFSSPYPVSHPPNGTMAPIGTPSSHQRDALGWYDTSTRVRYLKRVRLGALCVPWCAVRSTRYLPRETLLQGEACTIRKTLLALRRRRHPERNKSMSSLQQSKFKHSLAVQDAALLVLEAMEGDARA